jgi:hypothetical protein
MYFMSVIKAITSTISDVAGSVVSGPLKALSGGQDKFGSNSLRFPLDITGPEQSHFIRFNIIEVNGAKFKGSSVSRTSAQSDTEGNPLGTLIGGLTSGLGDVGTLAGSAITSLGLGDELNSLTSAASGAIDNITGLASGAVNGVLGGVAGIANAVTDKLPIVKDALSGLGDFPGSLGGLAQILNQSTGGTRESVGDILLFLPNELTDSYKTEWSNKEVEFAGNAFLNSGKVWEDLQNNYKSYLSEAGGKVLGGLVGSDAINQLNLKSGKGAGITGGAGGAIAVNPHVEFFFENVNPRTFSYTFKMSPKSIDEARAINEIIKTFKYHSAPESLGDEAGRYWKYPQIFQIEYWNSDITHKIGDCALTEISVNYAAVGDTHTFYDGQPLMTEMTLNFSELEIITKEEIEKGY